MRKLRVAVDIGGTFTDLVAYDEESHDLITVKTPSTPPGFIGGVLDAFTRAGIGPEDVTLFKHGSTIATNAIIQRTGAKTGLLTTAGMRDVLGAGRANRPDLFNSNWNPSPPLVPRRNVLTVRERVDYEGAVLTDLVEEDVRIAARKFTKRAIEAVAVAFLNSFMNGAHEARAKEILLGEMGDAVRVCTSAETLPEVREFERTSTTAANAYLMPVIETYLEQLESALRAWGYAGQILVTHSGGGVITARSAQRVPARICHSGPAGGVVGGLIVGQSAGFENVITFDMGGTSADLSLVEGAKPSLSSEWRVDWNIPILFPAIDLVAIGAGGGTIAWVDAGGSLRVGPDSAGADPGPACLGRGNEQPTITDAHLFLGRLQADRYLGGDVTIYPELAERAIATLAEKLEMSSAEAASGMLRIGNANMTSATHLISVQRGYDPREFALVAGGGAGPLHAVEVARELGIPNVIVPPTPGVTSALGILQVDLRHDILRSVLTQTAHLDPGALEQVFGELEAEAVEILEREQIPAERRQLELSVDVRYYGQTPYLNLMLDEAPSTAEAIAKLGERYADQYEREFGYRLAEEIASVEIVNARAAAIGLAIPAQLKPAAGESGEAKTDESRPVYFDEVGDFTDTPVYRRDRLGADATIDGPAIVEQADTTILIPPGARARTDASMNLVIAVDAATRVPAGLYAVGSGDQGA
ncbi:MAG TPA: hydantoinase/oxoprolinase family protein [Solirubrobacteraceae bacterium]|nr:hydantoinase/oxoprolinase family protein [Solirubrobacteraceae bacterium]